MTDRPRFAIMGSGGVGGSFGGRLAEAGMDVRFIARGAHLAAMRNAGLRINSPLGDAHMEPVWATDDPAEIGPVDYVLFATKLWDTQSAGQACRPLIGPETAVISLQNGVDAEGQLSDILGADHVMGGVSAISAVIGAPGVIDHLSEFATILFGELDGSATRRAERLMAALKEASIDAKIADDIDKTIWRKFIFVVGLSALTSVTRKTIGPLREDADCRALLSQLLTEAAAVARAGGVALDEDTVEDRLTFIDGLPTSMTSSMAGDLTRGNRLELEWLSGAVVRMGRERGIDTPANGFIHTALKLSASGGHES